ncbi:MAG TPA: hypothetical protein EYN70_11020 [Planctomycetaceae bacterium]|nr:hypothetical protein [Planctomycetaceae bacterium]
MSALLKKVEAQQRARKATSTENQSTNKQTARSSSGQPPAATSSPDITTVHFDHLAKLDTTTLTEVLQAVEPRILLLALVGASTELMNRITEPLSTADNRRLRGQMEQIGPLHLQDIATAQNLVVKTAARLAAEGRIQWPINARFAATA